MYFTQGQGCAMISPRPHLPVYPKPKPERPARSKSMTIAAGFRCFDGVLLTTDSEHSCGLSRYSGQKIWPIECGDFISGPQPNCSTLLVAAAGFDSTISETVTSLRNDEGIRGSSITFETIESAIRRCASGIGSTVLLLAVKLHTEQQARLLRVVEDEGRVKIVPLSSRTGDCCTFTGTEVAESMCREICDWLHSAGLPVLVMRELAKHILSRVSEYAIYCLPPIQSNYLFDTGRPELAEMRRDIRLPDYATGYLLGLQYDFGHALRSCVDPTVPEEMFEESLQHLIERLRTTRRRVLTP